MEPASSKFHCHQQVSSFGVGGGMRMKELGGRQSGACLGAGTGGGPPYQTLTSVLGFTAQPRGAQVCTCKTVSAELRASIAGQHPYRGCCLFLFSEELPVVAMVMQW